MNVFDEKLKRESLSYEKLPWGSRGVFENNYSPRRPSPRGPCPPILSPFIHLPIGPEPGPPTSGSLPLVL
jgi:hypothetical protein